MPAARHSTADTHPHLTLAAHWLSALAILMAYGLVWVRDWLDDDHLRDSLLIVHRQLGLLVLTLLCIRVFARLRSRFVHPEPLPQLLHIGATLSHLALYGLLLGMPLLGWTTTSAQGHPVQWMGWLHLPPLVQTDPDLADDLQDWHELGAWLLLGLLYLHLMAALWHHYIRRDGVLRSMLPFLKHQDRTASET